MRTWWIIKSKYSPGLAIQVLPPRWDGVRYKSAIGPYFSYKEAIEWLKKWKSILIKRKEIPCLNKMS